MMDEDAIRIRLYDVRFGDAILVSIPDSDEQGQPLVRHVLIDVGNVLTGEGGDDDVFGPVLADVASLVGDRGVDLYVMTHEHLDHVQGLLAGAKGDPPITIPIDTVWMTASADPDYYDTHPNAKRKLDESDAVYAAIERHLAAAPGAAGVRLRTLLENNNPRRTRDCVDHLRTQLTTDDRVHFIHREFATAGKHPFRVAEFSILAPEEDTSDYYGRFKPMAFGAGAGLSVGADASVVPPSGVDTTAFYNLVDLRSRGAMANALAIDKAKNNTSVVFKIGWRGRLLLFTGDAEVRSWKTMARECDLQPVDFLKVSHHGSHNGTPDESILDLILPADRPPDERPAAAVSTCLDTYNDVPHSPTLAELGRRCSSVVSTIDGPLFQDIFVEAGD